jgi:hypothetical protein
LPHMHRELSSGGSPANRHDCFAGCPYRPIAALLIRVVAYLSVADDGAHCRRARCAILLREHLLQSVLSHLPPPKQLAASRELKNLALNAGKALVVIFSREGVVKPAYTADVHIGIGEVPQRDDRRWRCPLVIRTGAPRDPVLKTESRGGRSRPTLTL